MRFSGLHSTAFVVAIAALLSLIICVPFGRQKDSQTRGIYAVAQHLSDAKITEMKKESLEQSISNLLTNEGQFYRNGSTLVQEDCLERFLAARRAVKVIQSIESLPVAEREKYCTQMFARSFELHSNTVKAIQKQWQDSSAPTNRQSLLSTREATCIAMFVAADLGLRLVLADEFEQLDRFRDDIVAPYIANHPGSNGSLERLQALTLIDLAVPDNRFQLNVLRLAALRGAMDGGRMRGLVDAALKTDQLRLTNSVLLITGWDAQTTSFEALNGGLLNTSRGLTQYEVFDWIEVPDRKHDELQDQQRQIIQRVRQLVFSK